ncbi:hypothetical protein, conserved [Babesia bigemina]|uniref:C3H1-type domain-containing protein n=1 Tax=Babesia bigemina TaxID=5866 RepID=A0A061BQ56_BABBI|nr:hypothetical protein, conserved [Babesia bigemina]CDR71597.1 hypothetical protein, conserved [Babesia bigemina]|eukprot:XP_012770544.1 hypothetical protein, conserved [Babesia bigemina]
MGFLSGVLSNIKEHLGQHKDTLNDAIESLNTNKHAGKKGFNDAIVKVVEGVGRYNDGVRNSSNHVKNKITDFDREMKRLKKTVSGIVQNNPVADETLKYQQAAEEIERRLAEYEKRAADFNNTLDMQHNDETTRNAINDLSDKLRDRIDNVRRTMVHEKSRLSELAAKEKERFQSLEACINTTLVGVGACVNREIGNKVKELIRDLRQMVQKMFVQLEKINKELPQFVERLQAWIQKADGDVGKTEGEVKKILEQVNDGLTSNKIPIDDAIKELEKTKIALETYISGEKSGLTGFVNNVNEAIGRLLNKVTGDTGPVDKSKTMEEIMQHIKKEVEFIRKMVGSEMEANKNDSGSVDNNWDALKSKIMTTAAQIHNKKDSSNPGYLGNMEKGVTAYAALFRKGEDKFGKIVEEWIGEIVEKEPVKDLLNLYFEQNRGAGYFNGRWKNKNSQALRGHVIPHLKQHIKDAANKIQPNINIDETMNVEDRLSYIVGYLKKFADEIVKQPSDIASKVAASVGAQHELVQFGNTAGHKKYNLELTVQVTLAALAFIAKNVANQLESFAITKTKLTTNLPVAIKQVDLIAEQFDLGTTLGGKIQTALDGVKPKIKMLHDNFGQVFQNSAGDDPDYAKAVDVAIKTVQSGIEAMNVDTIKGALADWTHQIKANFAALTGEISVVSRGISTQLAQLKKYISLSNGGNGLQKIHDDLHNLIGPVADAHKTAKKFLGSVDHSGTATIQELGRDVDSQVESAKRTLITQARKQYVTSLQGLLVAFSTKAEAELHPLPGLIDEELDLGVKGLLNTMSKKITTLANLAREDNKAKLTGACPIIEEYFSGIYTYIRSQIDDPEHLHRLLSHLHLYVDPLLESLAIHNFDHRFTKNLDELLKYVDQMRPRSLAEPSNPLAEALKEGLTVFGGELGKAYVSVYDGASSINWDQENNPETTYCAKIFLTLLQPLFDGLHELRQHCAIKAAWEHKAISLTEAAQHGNTITNPLGRFFQRCGYTVCSGPNKHNGELRNTAECRGGHINQKLIAEMPPQGTTKYKLVTKEDVQDAVLHRQPQTDDAASAKQYGILKQLVNHLHAYYSVCHLPHFAARKYPCSVFDMLKWLCGLTSSTVYNDLTVNGFDVLFEKDEKETEAVTDFVVVEEKPASLPAYPYDITSRKLSGELAEVCHYSQDVLTCLLGNGHADGIYACEFNTNNDGFMYPGNIDTLLCMLREILNRVYLQLHFLFQQCQYGTSLSGWLECEYGRDVGGSSWQCNTNQCADQKCKQIADQKRNQNCKLHPKCGVKSPLQSFLEDGLQGFLPHQIKYEKGKLECNVKGHSGIQCVTPMGFADISHVASLTQTGQRIADVLAGFCGNQMSPLAKMCSLLNCAILSAPKTLGEMFGFYYTLLNGWDRDDKNRKAHREDAYRNAVKNANFGDPSTELDISQLFKSTAHTGTSTTHAKGDLFMLVKCNGEKAALDPVGTCGSYLQPLCGDICNMYSKEHADKYLSWIVYLTETFYDLLSKLLEDCKSKCGSPKSRYQQQTCVKNCRAVVSSTKSPSLNHDEACKSIVQCQSSLPNLFKYGFYYGSASDLSGSYNNATKRSCKDFCKALERVLNKEENRGHVLADLVFKKLPDFLFTIRQPFIWMNMALWSLSLFYLLCVMVGRLDVLHIRSHLRIPSSHRITAQSLLAAAQVGRLAKISYLQP